MSYKRHFSRFLQSRPGRLHFAAHSHHPWPDVTLQAHIRAWEDAALLHDDKWMRVFEDLLPGVQQRIARLLGLATGSTIALAPNTHELVGRVFSCLEPPVRILTSDAEFHSFSRQSRRWEEAGLALVNRVPAEPFADFPQRFAAEIAGGQYQMVYLSHVFFDSGYAVPDLAKLVEAVADEATFVVIDGYHAFMALPVDLGLVTDRVFYLAGGYKYAMSGEGVCFLHCPPGYGPHPVDTGWFAGFGELEDGSGSDTLYQADGSRFLGATFDPSGLYRFTAVIDLLDSVGVDVAAIHQHVGELQALFLEGIEAVELDIGELIPDVSVKDRGHFLTFRTTRAGDLYRRLHELDVITDYRGTRLRVGFGIYHDPEDIEELVGRLRVAERG